MLLPIVRAATANRSAAGRQDGAAGRSAGAWQHGKFSIDQQPPLYILDVYTKEAALKTTKMFKSGNSWAVRLPKGYEFQSEEVEILRRGDEIILREKPKNLKRAFELLADLPSDCFSAKRKDLPPQKREDI